MAVYKLFIWRGILIAYPVGEKLETTLYYARVLVDPRHYARASQLLRGVGFPEGLDGVALELRSADALHLAVCTMEGLDLVTARPQMAANARKLGVRVYEVK